MTSRHANRTSFPRGVSGNPSGRPKMTDEIKEALGRLTPKALALLGKFIEDEECPPNVRLSAATHVLDRRFGKPVQAQEISGPDGGAIEISDSPEETRKRLVAMLLAQVAKQTQEETE